MKTSNISVVSFQGNLIDSLSGKDKLIKKFINLQESRAELSTQRIGQELLTNTLPKSLFARSFVDLCDNAFREIFENIIVYLGPKFVGEKILRKTYSGELKDSVVTTAAELMNKPSENNKKLMPVKAAIAMSALVIPLAEYSLSYVKNIFTLHMFKQADFNNIANLNKNKKEKTEHQEKVRESAKKHITLSGGLFAGCLAFSALLLTRGKNSKLLQHFSEAILAPGSKFFKNFKNNDKMEKLFNQYFGLDFDSKEVVDKAGKVVKDAAGNPIKKLTLSNGQITACVLAGFFGYTGAAKDRGKQDYKEVLYRFPLVGFYAISGAELFKAGLKKYLKKTNKCKELFEAEAQNGGKMPILNELEKFAKTAAQQKLAKMNKTVTQEELARLTKEEFTRLFKQKSALVGIPTLFGFTVMGLFVAGCSRYFTQYRYNQDLKKQKANSPQNV